MYKYVLNSVVKISVFAKYFEYYTTTLRTGAFFRGHTVECGPMPNVMAALLNIGGTVCSTAQFGCRPLPCSNAAKSQNPLKLAGVPQTNEPISATSGPTILQRHVGEILLFNKFFSDCQHVP